MKGTETISFELGMAKAVQILFEKGLINLTNAEQQYISEAVEFLSKSSDNVLNDKQTGIVTSIYIKKGKVVIQEALELLGTTFAEAHRNLVEFVSVIIETPEMMKKLKDLED